MKLLYHALLILGNFSEWEPELAIQLLRIPSVPNYAGVRKLIEMASAPWMEEFLQNGGLSVLFNSLEKLSASSVCGFSNTLLELEVVYAIKSVINSKVGIEFLLTQKQLTRQLIKGTAVVNYNYLPGITIIYRSIIQFMQFYSSYWSLKLDH